MSCYLLTWNPDKWSEEKFYQSFLEYENGQTIRWSCGNTKRKIVPGDTCYLIKQGKGTTGIIGAGKIVSSPYSETHYTESSSSSDKIAFYVDVKFDYLIPPNHSIPKSRYELQQRTDLASNIWNAQASGRTIPSQIETCLTELWESRIEMDDFVSPEEKSSLLLTEGAKKTIFVISQVRYSKTFNRLRANSKTVRVASTI